MVAQQTRLAMVCPVCVCWRGRLQRVLYGAREFYTGDVMAQRGFVFQHSRRTCACCVTLCQLLPEDRSSCLTMGAHCSSPFLPDLDFHAATRAPVRVLERGRKWQVEAPRHSSRLPTFLRFAARYPTQHAKTRRARMRDRRRGSR
jgi:hypothetical protein